MTKQDTQGQITCYEKQTLAFHDL